MKRFVGRTVGVCALLAFLVSSRAMAARSDRAYDGPVQEIALWRGEETIVRLDDKIPGELAALVSDGEVKVEVKSLAPTPYRVRVGSAQLASRYDRLVGAAKDGGSVYLKVSVPDDAKPGRHEFGPVRVRVVNRTLPRPKDWTYLLDLWQHPWAVARHYGDSPFSASHYEHMKTVWTTLAWCGVKSITTTLVDQPWNHQCYDAYHSMIRHVRHGDGRWTHDYALFDDYVAFARACGLGPRIDCYTMCPWGYVVRWEDEKGTPCRGTARPGTALFTEFWGAFLPDFVRHLKEKGWLEQTFIAMDERSPEDMKIIADFIRAQAPGLRIQLAGNRNPADFDGIVVDSFSVGLDHLTPEFRAESEKRRQQGLVTTMYVCCFPARPNTFMSSEDDEAFWLGAFPVLAGFDGFLRWAANSWPRNPTADAAYGKWPPGDTFLVYPDGSPSARLVSLRRGVVCAEKWRLLAELKLFARERGELSEKWGDERRALAGPFDFGACRREIETLVNRD